MELIQDKVENGNNIELIQKQPNAFITIGKTLFSLLPTIMLVILFVLIFKMQGLGEKGKVCRRSSEKKTDHGDHDQTSEAPAFVDTEPDRQAEQIHER